MNLHREMINNLVDLGKIYNSGKADVKVIRRSRYNRYMKIKAKLALIKQEILDLRKAPPKRRLVVTFNFGDDDNTSKPPSVAPSQATLPKKILVRPATEKKRAISYRRPSLYMNLKK